jgi:chromosome partitioning protein
VLINTTMGQIICVASQKGGTGKTTTAVNLAASLALLEKHTLLVDCDPLGNATTGVGVDKGDLSHDIFDALTGRASIREIITDSALDFLQVLPSRAALHYIEGKLGEKKSEQILRNITRDISRDYDFIIVDSPPSFGFLTQCALASADFLLLPLQYSVYAFEGLSQFLMMIRHIREELNPSLKIAGVFYTMFQNKTGKDILFHEKIPHPFERQLFSTVIPWDDTLSRAADMGKPAALVDILSKGCVAYMELSLELIAAVSKIA